MKTVELPASEDELDAWMGMLTNAKRSRVTTVPERRSNSSYRSVVTKRIRGIRKGLCHGGIGRSPDDETDIGDIRSTILYSRTVV